MEPAEIIATLFTRSILLSSLALDKLMTTGASSVVLATLVHLIGVSEIMFMFLVVI